MPFRKNPQEKKFQDFTEGTEGFLRLTNGLKCALLNIFYRELTRGGNNAERRDPQTDP